MKNSLLPVAILAAFILCLTPCVLRAGSVTYALGPAETNSFYVLQDQVMTLTGCAVDKVLDSEESSYGNIKVKFSNQVEVSVGAVYYLNQAPSITPGTPFPFKIAGPAIVTLVGSTNKNMFFTFDLAASGDPSSLPVLPSGLTALVEFRTTTNLLSGQWTSLFSEIMTNGITEGNRFFQAKLTLLP